MFISIDMYNYFQKIKLENSTLTPKDNLEGPIILLVMFLAVGGSSVKTHTCRGKTLNEHLVTEHSSYQLKTTVQPIIEINVNKNV